VAEFCGSRRSREETTYKEKKKKKEKKNGNFAFHLGSDG
jgi:Na+-transporting NADH:ubiquinone oxidoreductase subunit NqrF